MNPQGCLLDALAPRCRHQSAGPSTGVARGIRTRNKTFCKHLPHCSACATFERMYGFGLLICQSKIQNRKSKINVWGDVSDSNRRRLSHSQESSPLDEHPHKSCGERTRTFALRFQRPAFVPAQTTPHQLVPPRGLKPRTVRLEDACAVHLRHGGEWCIWRDSNSHCAGSKPAASTNWATDALVR